MRKKKFSSRQQQGVTLLELMLVLIVMAVIAFFAINRYQLYRHQKDIIALKQNIDLLFQATNVYYHVCCSASQGLKQQPDYCQGPSPDKQFQVDRDKLKKMLKVQNLNQILINTDLAKSESNYDVAAQFLGQTQQTQKPIYQLEVKATLNVPIDTMNFYQKILGATKIGDNPQQLVWQKLPSYAIPNLSSGLWIMNEGLRQFKESVATEQGDDTCAY